MGLTALEWSATRGALDKETSSNALRGSFLSHRSQFIRAKHSDQFKALQIVIHTRNPLRWARIGHERQQAINKSALLRDKRGILILTLNQWVPGSSPGGRTKLKRNPREIEDFFMTEDGYWLGASIWVL